MPGLLDIGPLTRKVTVAGIEIEIFPLTVNHVFVLIDRYKSFSELMTKREVPKAQMGQLAMELLAPDALAYCMVACTGGAELTQKEKAALGGKYSDGYAEKLLAAREEKWLRAQEKAKILGAGDCLAIFDTMYEISFSEGIGPFVARLKAAQTNVLKMKTSFENSGVTSQEESSDGLETDEHLPKLGLHRPARSTPGPNSATQSKPLH